MSNCKHCNAQIPAGALFCPRCGADLREENPLCAERKRLSRLMWITLFGLANYFAIFAIKPLAQAQEALDNRTAESFGQIQTRLAAAKKRIWIGLVFSTAINALIIWGACVLLVELYNTLSRPMGL